MAVFYPNEKVGLKKGGRNSDKISAQEFKDLIKKIYENVAKKESEVKEEYEWDDLSWMFYFNEYLPKVAKDLKYDFDFENIVEQDGGVKFTKGGTPYLDFICGGDWEAGLLLYVYPANNTLRVYIPTKGNTVRKDLKCVFGSENEIPMLGGYKDYQEELDAMFDERLAYLNKYASTPITELDDVEINKDWCLEDFETRLGER